MPKQHLNSHSLYQTELLGDQHATLKKIETNTKNINVNVGDVEINVADLEGLQTINNTKTTSIDTRLDSVIGAVNNMSAIGEGSSQFKSVSLGYDRTNGLARAILVDSGGIIQTHDSVAEASLTSLEGKIDTFAGETN